MKPFLCIAIIIALATMSAVPAKENPSTLGALSDQIAARPTATQAPAASAAEPSDKKAKALELLPKEQDGRTTYALHQGVRQFKENGKFGLLDEQGAVLLAAAYDSIDPFGYEGVMKVKSNGLYGLVRLADGLVMEPQWQYVSYFQDGMAFVVDENEMHGYVDRDFKLVIPCQYDAAWRFSEGVAPVLVREGWRYIDQSGAFISDIACDPSLYEFNLSESNDYELYPTYYDYPYVVSEGMILTQSQSGKYGFMDTNGNEIAAPIYDDAGVFYDDRAPVQVNGKWGFIDKTGQIVIPCQWDDVCAFENGYAVVIVGDDEEYYVIDQAGTVRLDIQALGYSRSWYYMYGGMLPVRVGGAGAYEEWGFINIDGEEVVAPVWWDVGYYQEGLSLVTANGAYGGGDCGFVDLDGNMVIPATLYYAEDFSDGLAIAVRDAPVYDGGHYGFIDKAGNWVIEDLWDYAESFANGIATVYLEESDDASFEYIVYLNRQGEVIAVL